MHGSGKDSDVGQRYLTRLFVVTALMRFGLAPMNRGTTNRPPLLLNDDDLAGGLLWRQSWKFQYPRVIGDDLLTRF